METIEKPKRGRPSVDANADVISGGNAYTGESLAWSNGHFAGTPRLKAEALYWCGIREPMPVPSTGAFVEADATDPLAAYAVIAYVVGEPCRIEYSGGRLAVLLDEADAFVETTDDFGVVGEVV